MCTRFSVTHNSRVKLVTIHVHWPPSQRWFGGLAVCSVGNTNLDYQFDGELTLDQVFTVCDNTMNMPMIPILAGPGLSEESKQSGISNAGFVMGGLATSCSSRRLHSISWSQDRHEKVPERKAPSPRQWPSDCNKGGGAG